LLEEAKTASWTVFLGQKSAVQDANLLLKLEADQAEPKNRPEVQASSLAGELEPRA
jgi:hypothetical protein